MLKSLEIPVHALLKAKYSAASAVEFKHAKLRSFLVRKWAREFGDFTITLCATQSMQISQSSYYM